MNAIIFDASGQSQELVARFAATTEGAAPTTAQDYSFWVRRQRRVVSFSQRDRNDAINESESAEWVYWLVGEDGTILTSGLTLDGMMAVVSARVGERETNHDDSHTNYGAF